MKKISGTERLHGLGKPRRASEPAPSPLPATQERLDE